MQTPALSSRPSDSFVAPSGAVLLPSDLKLIKLLNMIGFVTREKELQKLVSGQESYYYVRGREDTSDNPIELLEIGRCLATFIRARVTCPPDLQICLLPIPTAATKFAAAASLWEASQNVAKPICFRESRTTPKGHGVHRGYVNGAPRSDHYYVRLENVATTGGSVVNFDPNFVADGYPQQMEDVIIIDREMGSTKKFRETNHTQVHVMCTLRDYAAALVYLKEWPAQCFDEIVAETAPFR